MIRRTAISPVTEWADGIRSPIHLVGTERRSKMRYPIVLKVRYRTLSRKLHIGEGRAVNLSSGGALVVCRHQLGVGVDLEIRLEWPSLLDGWIPLQLVTLASVVRCGSSSFAVCFRRHQFRTLRSTVQRFASIADSKKEPAGAPAKSRAHESPRHNQ
jgi:hypothetical protein